MRQKLLIQIVIQYSLEYKLIFFPVYERTDFQAKSFQRISISKMSPFIRMSYIFVKTKHLAFADMHAVSIVIYGSHYLPHKFRDNHHYTERIVNSRKCLQLFDENVCVNKAIIDFSEIER